MCTKDVAAAFHNSAYGTAHLDTEVSKDMPCHASFFESLAAAAPCTSSDGAVWTNDTVLST